MDEQKLNEAAEQDSQSEYSLRSYVGAGIRKAGFKAGARWHEQQNPWRKVEDELPDLNKWVTIKKSDNTYHSVLFSNKELLNTLRNTFIEWKYIED